MCAGMPPPPHASAMVLSRSIADESASPSSRTLVNVEAGQRPILADRERQPCEVRPPCAFNKFDVATGGLTEDDREAIFDLAETGMKAWSIAKVLRRHPSTVSYFMYRQGLKELSLVRRQPYWRKGVLVVPFTIEEDDFIEQQSIKGVPASRIGEMVGERFGTARSGDTITGRLMLLASDETARDVA